MEKIQITNPNESKNRNKYNFKPIFQNIYGLYSHPL